MARVGKSRSAAEDESIYNRITSPDSAQPVVRTYNIVVQPPPVPLSGAPVAEPAFASPTSYAGNKPRMHVDSSQIQGIFYPIQGPRDVQIRAGIKPPNHAKSNISAVKEQSSLNRLRKMAQQNEEPKPRASLVRSASAGPARQPSYDGGRDFLQENKLVAGAPLRTKAEPKGDDGLKYLNKPDFGRVPTYLLERKIQLIEKQEEEAKAREAALIPPGMRLLDESERLETLATLQRNRAELERALQGLPLKIETVGQIRRRDEMEKRMREIEEGLRVFSKPKVLVKL